MRLAVEVFVPISGLVIAGRVLDQHERRPGFMIRRAFQIFPADPIALTIGAIGPLLAIAALDRSGCHIPILKILRFVLPLQMMRKTLAVAALALTAVALRLLVSEIMNRLVERPMIRAGTMLARRVSAPRQALPVATAHATGFDVTVSKTARSMPALNGSPGSCLPK